VESAGSVATNRACSATRLDTNLIAQVISNSLESATNKLSTEPNSVNQSAAVNRERSRDSAILAGVGARKLAILDVDLAGRDEQLGAAVSKKPAKTRDLNEKSRDSRLGFLCLPDAQFRTNSERLPLRNSPRTNPKLSRFGMRKTLEKRAFSVLPVDTASWPFLLSIWPSEQCC
jgi:hypothetical protein